MLIQRFRRSLFSKQLCCGFVDLNGSRSNYLPEVFHILREEPALVYLQRDTRFS